MLFLFHSDVLFLVCLCVCLFVMVYCTGLYCCTSSSVLTPVKKCVHVIVGVRLPVSKNLTLAFMCSLFPVTVVTFLKIGMIVATADLYPYTPLFIIHFKTLDLYLRQWVTWDVLMSQKLFISSRSNLVVQATHSRRTSPISISYVSFAFRVK